MKKEPEVCYSSSISGTLQATDPLVSGVGMILTTDLVTETGLSMMIHMTEKDSEMNMKIIIMTDRQENLTLVRKLFSFVLPSARRDTNSITEKKFSSLCKDRIYKT